MEAMIGMRIATALGCPWCDECRQDEVFFFCQAPGPVRRQTRAALLRLKIEGASCRYEETKCGIPTKRPGIR